jgi:hypothetical protein
VQFFHRLEAYSKGDTSNQIGFLITIYLSESIKESFFAGDFFF